MAWNEPGGQLEQEHQSSVFDNLNVEDDSLEEQVLLDHQEELDFAHLEVYEKGINDDGTEENDFDFSSIEIEGQEERDDNLYAGLRLQEFLRVTEDYLDWLEEQCQATPTYEHLRQHLTSETFERYVGYEVFRERLTDRLKNFAFKGSSDERRIVFDLLNAFGLKALLVQLKLNLHRHLHKEFSGRLSKEDILSNTFLNKLLDELELVSPFSALLTFIDTDQFIYCARLEAFRLAVTKQLKNYYFYGDWQVRHQLVDMLRKFSMDELADFIASIGLKDPDQQIGQATKGFEA